MQYIGADAVAAALPWPALIEAIESTLTDPGAFAPERTVHTVPVGDGRPDASLLLKPGWVIGDVIAVKVVTFLPDNGTFGRPTVNGGVLLLDGSTGALIGACDGNELTARRTAAASAAAAKRLVRDDVRRLLVIGTGALAPMVAQAHGAVRSFDRIEVWGRSAAKAERVVTELVSEGMTGVTVSSDLDRSVREAEVISAVTAATEPLIAGALLAPGTHVDLIGGFTPTMREADDAVITRSAVWVDSRSDGILAGDLAQPLSDGLLSPDDIVGDLVELIDGSCPGRNSPDQITVFKSAGIALEDVAAARLVFGDTRPQTTG